MPSVSKSIKIERPHGEAFALATDPARFEEWLTLHAGWPDGPPTEIAEGDRFTQSLKIMGMPADLEWTVQERTDERLVLSGSGPMGTQLTTTIVSVRDGESAMVSYEADFSGAAVQGPMADMITTKAGDEIAASLQKLRDIA